MRLQPAILALAILLIVNGEPAYAEVMDKMPETSDFWLFAIISSAIGLLCVEPTRSSAS